MQVGDGALREMGESSNLMVLHAYSWGQDADTNVYWHRGMCAWSQTAWARLEDVRVGGCSTSAGRWGPR